MIMWVGLQHKPKDVLEILKFLVEHVEDEWVSDHCIKCQEVLDHTVDCMIGKSRKLIAAIEAVS